MSTKSPRQDGSRKRLQIAPLAGYDVPTASGQVSSAAYPTNGPSNPPPLRVPAPQEQGRPAGPARQDGATFQDLQPGVIGNPRAGRPGNTDGRPAIKGKGRA